MCGSFSPSRKSRLRRRRRRLPIRPPQPPKPPPPPRPRLSPPRRRRRRNRPRWRRAKMFPSISATSLSARARSRSRPAIPSPGPTRMKCRTPPRRKTAPCSSRERSLPAAASVRRSTQPASFRTSASSIPTCKARLSSNRASGGFGKDPCVHAERGEAMKPTRAGTMILALILAILGGIFLTASGGQAQDASPERPSHIHEGSCDELGAVIQPLTFLNVPSGPVAGSSGAVVAEAAFTSIPQTLDELLAADHSLKVHLSREQIEIYLACGDIGGALDADGALIVGMKELDGSGYTGIAYLVPAANGTTSISVMIAQVLPGAPGAADATAQDATPAAADAAPNIVNVTLTEFTIDMPTQLAAGATRFVVANN